MVFNSDRPIYIQLAEDFKYKIACGSISLGEQLPSTTELTRAYNINQNTVLQAYELLKNQGLSVTKRGVGTFVVNDKKTLDELRKQLKDSIVKNYKEQMWRLGFDTDEMVEAIYHGEKE